MSNCIIYTRVNGRTVSAKEHSIQGQTKICRDYAKRHHLKILTAYSDIASGADSLRERKGLLQALYEAERTGSHLLVSDLDRLARNPLTHFQVQNRLSEWGGKIVSVDYFVRQQLSMRIKEGIRLANKRR